MFAPAEGLATTFSGCSSIELLGDGSILAGGVTGDSSWGDFAMMKLVF